MNITDELRKLVDLHQAGQLTDEEFVAAKKRLLAEDDAAPAEVGAATADPDVDSRTYRSSRWSAGNLFFPDALTLARDGMLFRKGALFGSSEEHINYRAVASCRVKNGVFLSSLTVETSGGSQPIFINGLWKSDAREIQEYLRAFQRG